MPRLFKIILRIGTVALRRTKRPRSLDERSTPESLGWHKILDAISRMLPGATRLQMGHYSRWRVRKHIVVHLITGIALLLFWIAIQVCGVMPSLIATDSIALSEHPNCGVYFPNATDDREMFSISREYESITWAQSCYGPAEGSDGCDLLLQDSIPKSVEESVRCPFGEHMCHGGSNSAVRFSTGPVDARTIGINTPHRYEFQRSTTCSPLNMNESYVRLSRGDGGLAFDYYYGGSVVYGKASWNTSYSIHSIGAPTYVLGLVLHIETPIISEHR